jgi:hypothetical protein
VSHLAAEVWNLPVGETKSRGFPPLEEEFIAGLQALALNDGL